MSKHKVLIVGAGQVGSSIARHILSCGIADVMLYDVVPGIAAGTALDLSHCIFEAWGACDGTDDVERAFARADMVVFTAGAPRHKGQTRDDLLMENARVALKLAAVAVQRLPEALFFVITNPVDILATIVKRAFPSLPVLGLGCGLDTMRFRHYIATFLQLPVSVVDAIIIGAHNDTMLPLWNAAKAGTLALAPLISAPDREQILQDTRTAGDRIVQALGRGSSVAAGVLGAQMIGSCFAADGKVYSADCLLADCYGVKNGMISLPCTLARTGGVPQCPPLDKAELSRMQEISRHIDTQAKRILDNG